MKKSLLLSILMTIAAIPAANADFQIITGSDSGVGGVSALAFSDSRAGRANSYDGLFKSFTRAPLGQALKVILPQGWAGAADETVDARMEIFYDPKLSWDASLPDIEKRHNLKIAVVLAEKRVYVTVASGSRALSAEQLVEMERARTLPGRLAGEMGANVFAIESAERLSDALRRFVEANGYQLEYSAPKEITNARAYQVSEGDFRASLLQVLKPYGLSARIHPAGGSARAVVNVFPATPENSSPDLPGSSVQAKDTQ